ncbi:MAG: hypothetical protein AAGK14_02915 [Verrucomicrobiota bacterium]
MASSERFIIVGNGPSLLRLSHEEKERIQQGPSLSLNHYIQHYRQAGFTTTHYGLVDDWEPTRTIFRNLPELLSRPEWSAVTCLFSPYWAGQVAEAVSPDRVHLVKDTLGIGHVIKWTLRRRPGFYNYCYHNPIALWNRLQGRETVFKRKPQFERIWPREPSDPLVWINGTLVIALSYAYREGYREVELVGVDLNDGTHFYSPQEDMVAYDSKRFGRDTLKDHTTVMWGFPRPSPPIQYLLRWIREIYEADGRSLTVANESSLLARENILPLKPLLA